MLNEKNRMKRMKSWEGPSFLYSSDLTGCWEAGILFFFSLASSGCRQSSLLCAVGCCMVLHHRTCRYLVFFVFCFVYMSCPLPATYVESPLRLLRGTTIRTKHTIQHIGAQTHRGAPCSRGKYSQILIFRISTV